MKKFNSSNDYYDFSTGESVNIKQSYYDWAKEIPREMWVRVWSEQTPDERAKSMGEEYRNISLEDFLSSVEDYLDMLKPTEEKK